MKRILSLLLIFLSVCSFGKNRLQSFIDNEFSKDGNVANSAVAIYVEDADGHQLAAFNPDMPLAPASTMKTVTTGVACNVLGPDFRFSTKIACSGKVDANGRLDGDLYILGGGDPTIGMEKDLCVKADSVFGIWKAALDKAGIKSIGGRIIGDDRIFSDECSPSVWTYGNIASTSGCGSCGLPFALNRSVFRITPGETPGEPAFIEAVSGAVPELEILNEVVTDEKKSGTRNIACRVVRPYPIVHFYGTYPAGHAPRIKAVSNQFGAWTFAFEFFKYLEENGINAGGYDEITNLRRRGETIYAPEALTPLAETFSPKLKDIIYVTNRVSQNFLAETIFKTVGKRLMEKEKGETVYGVSYRQSIKALRKFLSSENVDLTGFSQSDGSGLSRHDNISPRFLTRFYLYMMDKPFFNDYLTSFPVPGEYGTLDKVLRREDSPLKKNIHAKSGTLDNVRAYAGYVNTGSGSYLRFAVILNNLPCSVEKVQPMVEKLLLQIALAAEDM